MREKFKLGNLKSDTMCSKSRRSSELNRIKELKETNFLERNKEEVF